MMHPTRTRAPWLSKLFGRGLRTPIRRAPQTRLGVERLEDRVVPVTQVQVGQLLFVAGHGNTSIDFTDNGTEFWVGNEGDTVSVGFAPSSQPVTVTALGLVNGQISSLTVQGLTEEPQASSYTLKIGDASYAVSTVSSVQGGEYQLLLTTAIPSSAVSVGAQGTFVSGDETFKPLLQFTVDENDVDVVGKVTIKKFEASNQFEASGPAEMNLVVGSGSPTKPIPIWKQTEIGDDQDFDINTLLGFGQSLDTKHSQPITVADWVDFQLSGLVLSPGDETTGPRVGMQGKGSISSKSGVDFSKIGFIQDLEVEVSGTNYVWANKDGITVTGFEGEVDLSIKDYTLAGYKLTGDVAVGYSDPGDGNKRISIGGGVQLTAPAGEAVKLENVSGNLEVSLGSENGTPKFYGFTLAVDGTFKAGGLSVTTLNDFGFSYNFDGPSGRSSAGSSSP